MPSRLKLIALILGIIALAVLVGLLTAPQERAVSSPSRSSYNADAAGCRGFYELLSETEKDGPLRLRRVGDLQKLRGVLIVVGRLRKPLDENDARELEQWVRSGNGLLYFVGVEETPLAPSALDRLLKVDQGSRVPAKTRTISQRLVELQGNFPAFRPARRLLQRTPADYAFCSAQEGVELYADWKGPAVLWRQWGEGQVIVCASSAPIQNSLIGDYSNLAFLLCALRVLRPAGGRIIFDEFHHGFVGSVSLASLFSVEGVLAAFIQLAICGLLYLWLQGRRMGPPVPIVAGRRRTAAEYLHAAGALYRQHCAPGEIAAAYGAFAVRTLCRGLGLTARGIEPEPLALLLARRSHGDAAKIGALLVRATSAARGQLSAREATELIRALDDLMSTV